MPRAFCACAPARKSCCWTGRRCGAQGLKMPDETAPAGRSAQRCLRRSRARGHADSGACPSRTSWTGSSRRPRSWARGTCGPWRWRAAWRAEARRAAANVSRASPLRRPSRAVARVMHGIRTVRNFRQALEALKGDPPDLLLTAWEEERAARPGGGRFRGPSGPTGPGGGGHRAGGRHCPGGMGSPASSGRGERDAGTAHPARRRRACAR